MSNSLNYSILSSIAKEGKLLSDTTYGTENSVVSIGDTIEVPIRLANGLTDNVSLEVTSFDVPIGEIGLIYSIELSLKNYLSIKCVPKSIVTQLRRIFLFGKVDIGENDIVVYIGKTNINRALIPINLIDEDSSISIWGFLSQLIMPYRVMEIAFSYDNLYPNTPVIDALDKFDTGGFKICINDGDLVITSSAKEATLLKGIQTGDYTISAKVYSMLGDHFVIAIVVKGMGRETVDYFPVEISKSYDFIVIGGNTKIKCLEGHV